PAKCSTRDDHSHLPTVLLIHRQQVSYCQGQIEGAEQCSPGQNSENDVHSDPGKEDEKLLPQRSLLQAHHVHSHVSTSRDEAQKVVDLECTDAAQFWSPTEAGLRYRNLANSRGNEMSNLMNH